MKNGHQRIVEELLGVKDENATCDNEDTDKRGTCTEEEKAPVQKVTKIIVYHVHMHAWLFIRYSAHYYYSYYNHSVKCEQCISV